MSHLIVCVYFLLLFATLPTASAHSFPVITPTNHALLSTHQVKRFISIKWWENETTREQNNTPTKESNFHFYNTCINGWLSNMLHVHSISWFSSPFRHRSVTLHPLTLCRAFMFTLLPEKQHIHTRTKWHVVTSGCCCVRRTITTVQWKAFRIIFMYEAATQIVWRSLMPLRTHNKLRRWSARLSHIPIWYIVVDFTCTVVQQLISAHRYSLATSPSPHFCICVRKGIFHSNFVHYVEYFIRGRAC